MRGFYLFLAFIFSFNATAGNEVSLKAQLSKPFAKLGEPFDLIVVARYPVHWQTVFPDSAYSFPGFVCLGKKYANTRSEGEFSVDSVRYRLSTFDLDSQRKIALPVYFYPPGDSLKKVTDSLPFYLQELLPNPAPDTLQFIANGTFLPIQPLFNVYYWAAGGSVSIVLLVTLFLLFGRKVLAYFKKQKLIKQYAEFSRTFYNYQKQAEQTPGPEPIERAFVAWKEWIQTLTEVKITALSGSELAGKKEFADLEGLLKALDRAVYSRKVPEDLPHKLAELLRHAQYSMERKLIELEHRKKK